MAGTAEPTSTRRNAAPGFEAPSVAVDVVCLTQRDEELRVLLIRRHEPPFRDRWVLPGGFVRIDEGLAAAAARVLRSKSGLSDTFLEQLYTFGATDRDPRARIISVAYYALVAWEQIAGLDSSDDLALGTVVVPWAGEQGGPVDARVAGRRARLGFDHDDIVGMAIKRIRGKLNYAPIGYQLLPEQFTLLDLQRVHEAIAGHRLNKDSFRRRMLASEDIEATGERQEGVGHRPAALYRFTRRSAI